MSKRVHIVECDSGGSWPVTIFWLAVVVIIYGGCKWTYDHVLLPALHVLGMVLFYGGIAFGALLGLSVSAFIVVCVVERVRRVRSRRSNRLAYMPGYRLALKNSSAPIRGTLGAPNSELPTRPVTAHDIVSAYPAQIIDNEDKTFMFLHGIMPESFNK